MTLPSTMKAIKVQDAGKAAVVDVPLPKLRPDYILVKVAAVALNPTDWKHIHYLPTKDATVGCDYVGTVVDIGDKVSKKFSKGDRVAGFVHGVNSAQTEDGAFGEYLVAKGDLQIKVPDNVSDETAATLGVGVATIGQGMYQTLGLPTPEEPTKDKMSLLIYGGSTATGLFAISWAKLSGLTVVTTCSPHNFELVKSYGADAVFDYSDSECAKKIREYTDNKLEYAFDCISEKSSPQICADALSTNGGQYSALLAVDFPRKDVKAGYTLAYTIIGEPFDFRDNSVPAKPEDLEFGVKHWAMAERLLDQGKFKVPPIGNREGGLEGVFEGLEELKSGKVSGTKLVYRIA